MTSWRDTTSALAQNDLDGLLNAVLPFAEESLSKHGEFYPFGAAVSAGGQTSLLGGDPALGEKPNSDAVLGTLYEAVRSEAAGLRAAAFVADVRAGGSDAVRVELEHAEGVSLVVLLPYTRSRFKRTLEFGPMSVSAADLKVWTQGVEDS